MRGNAPFGISHVWPSCWIWAALSLVALLDTAWILITPLQFDPSGLEFPLCTALALFLIAVGLWRALPSRLLLFMMGTSFVLCAWPTLRVFNHLVMTIPLPLADDLLSKWDIAFGFDWQAYVFWIDAHPLLARAMDFSYIGLTLFSCVAFVILIAFGEIEAAGDFIVMFFWSAIIASTIGALFPAHTAMVHYAPIQEMLKHVVPDYGVAFAPFLDDIRSNPTHTLRFSDLIGLTSFPSFHTTMALIAIYCSRTRAVLLVPSLLFNGLMIAATPVYGGHYLVDLLGGAVLFALLLAVQRKVSVNAWLPLMPKPWGKA